jgi:hypothetical protein
MHGRRRARFARIKLHARRIIDAARVEINQSGRARSADAELAIENVVNLVGPFEYELAQGGLVDDRTVPGCTGRTIAGLVESQA